MARKIKGVIYYWIDTIFEDDMIYDIYENSQGHRVAIPSGIIE